MNHFLNTKHIFRSNNVHFWLDNGNNRIRSYHKCVFYHVELFKTP